ncbi:STAS domain-containing protein [bacterium]|nr:STAS domain-containing protein [bacterium]
MEAINGLTLWDVHEDDQVVIYVRGELDFATTPHLIKTIRNIKDENVDKYVIDCEEVTFIDSETLKYVLGLRKDFAQCGRRLWFRKCSPQVKRILDLLGLSDQLIISEPAEA